MIPREFPPSSAIGRGVGRGAFPNLTEQRPLDWSAAGYRASLWLNRLRWLGAVMVFALGFAVAALERWRPELIEPARKRLARPVGDLVGPVGEWTRHGRQSFVRGGRLWDVEKRDEALRHEMMRLESELQVTREEARRLARISGLSEWRAPDDLDFIPADVIGFSTEDQSALFTINRGRRDGISEGLPVVGRRGLAGVVREVSERSARVQALTDPLSAVGVADLESRKRGVVLGRGREANPEFIPENEVQPIEPGSVLITSAFGDSIYPKGLVVGRLMERRTNMRGLVYGVVEMAEDFSSLEEALVIRPADRPAAGAAPARLGDYTVQMPTRIGDAPTTGGVPPRLAVPPGDARPVWPPVAPSPVRGGDRPTTPTIGTLGVKP